MRIRRDGKKYIQKACETINKMPDSQERQVMTQAKRMETPISAKGSDRDERYQSQPVSERFVDMDTGEVRTFSGVFEPKEKEEVVINNESFNQAKALYEDA